MANIFELQAQLRTDTGKSASRKMRRLEDNIPAVIYGKGFDSLHISLEHNKVKKALANESFYSHILTLDLGNSKEKAVLKAVQRHPYKPRIMHMDFQRISAHEKLTMHIPLHFKGEDIAPGVKIKGGVISHLANSVDVSCLPADLPEFIDVDVSNLDLDQTIHLSDLKLPKGVELIDLAHGDDKTLVSIHLPRSAIEEASAETEEETEEAAPTAAAPEEESE